MTVECEEWEGLKAAFDDIYSGKLITKLSEESVVPTFWIEVAQRPVPCGNNPTAPQKSVNFLNIWATVSFSGRISTS